MQLSHLLFKLMRVGKSLRFFPAASRYIGSQKPERENMPEGGDELHDSLNMAFEVL